MDTEKLKSRIREALGGAGIPREISEQVDGIIDSVAGKKEAQGEGREASDDERKAKVQRDQAQLRTQPARGEREVPDEDDEAPRSVKAAETRAKPARKTKTARKKK